MPWRLGVLLLAIGTLLFPVASLAQPTVPDVPKEIAVPPGHKLLMKVEGKGVQIYKAVEGKSGASEWVLEAPLADLFDSKGGKAGWHYDNPPSWEAADGSMVVRSLQQGRVSGEIIENSRKAYFFPRNARSVPEKSWSCASWFGRRSRGQPVLCDRGSPCPAAAVSPRDPRSAERRGS